MKYLTFSVFTFIIFCVSCSNPEVQKPNILWISCEDISSAMGCYGDENATTPNIDALADQGYIFEQAFSNAPICAPARSTLITGMYATSLGTQNLRSVIPVPASLKILPQYLKDAGYFTSNNVKTDYNFSAEGRWDALSDSAHWRKRPQNTPFFSVFNFGITHEGHANSDVPKDTESLDKKHDPKKMVLPPYYPETDEFYSIMAHQYDLITVFDQKVGELINQLKEDGVYDNTIIFVFADHGFGLPRYKRWLYNSGMRVPFVMHVPEKYKDKVKNLTSPSIEQMVGFVDFAPTVLSLAGVPIPETMEGKNFLGENTTPKKYIFGYRDRADDVYDMSRSVYDGKYIFIRNYMPHKPYIQNAVIFNRGKRSFTELHRLKNAGLLPDESLKMFEPKPVTELYNLEEDPFELNNLAEDPNYSEIVSELSTVLKTHIVKSFDSGLLNEGEMMERSYGSSVYEMLRDANKFNAEKLYEIAELVGKVEKTETLIPYLESTNSTEKYWALVALDAFHGDISSCKSQLIEISENGSSAVNRALASEILINKLNYLEALDVLKQLLQEEDETILLQVVIAIRNISDKATPLVPYIKEKIYPKISGTISGRYKSWSYPMFIGMSLDQILNNCGIEN